MDEPLCEPVEGSADSDAVAPMEGAASAALPGVLLPAALPHSDAKTPLRLPQVSSRSRRLSRRSRRTTRCGGSTRCGHDLSQLHDVLPRAEAAAAAARHPPPPALLLCLQWVIENVTRPEGMKEYSPKFEIGTHLW